MKITPLDYRLQIKQEGPARSECLHISTVIRDIGFTLGYLKPEYMGTEMHPEIIELGHAWENHVFPKFHPEVMHNPGELIINNMAMTADGVSWVQKGKDGRTKIHECKTTKKSMRRESDLAGEWLWLSQTMTYCYGWETNLAQWMVLWLNGDYSRSGPNGNTQYRLYDLEFTPREINENFRMINSRARDNHGLVELRKQRMIGE